MSSFEILSANMKKKIWDMKWDRFTPIQEKTIPIIIHTKKDVIISSGTASGKTEAAMLPVLSLIEKEARNALKVIYISPLKALINNQFERIDKLCEYSDIAIHRWHGDVSQSKKEKFLKNPTGILQITPESIESLFVNRTNQLKASFKEVEFIVIDEIHSFFDNARGVHLRSLLSRLTNYTTVPPRIVGLSATIENFDLVKNWVNYANPGNVDIVEVKGSDKELMFHLMHIPSDTSLLPLELFEDIRELIRHQKSIIFCNNRGQVEETTVALNRLAAREGMGETYYPHHSSIDKKEREYVEKVMSESTHPKSVVATSSLELGIDIGNIEVVIQIDSTYSVSSLKQRLGRSGRKRDAAQMLQLYSTDDDSLVQSLAVMELIIEKWVEPSKGYLYPFDVLFQQLISISQEHNGIPLEELMGKIKRNDIFHELPLDDVEHLIQHMIDKEFLEIVRGSQEIIVGLEGERILRSKDFYAVFLSTEEYEVMEGIKKIGRLDKAFIINIGDHIILGGRLWSIKDIDYDRNKVYVTKAASGKKPAYTGGPGSIHKKIAEKMMEILCSEKVFTYVNASAMIALNEISKKYWMNKVTSEQRVIWIDKDEGIFESYTGTTITKTLVWMLRYFGVGAKVKDGIGRIAITKPNATTDILHQIKNKQWTAEELLPYIEEHELFQSKYTEQIGPHLQVKMHIANEINIEETVEYLKQYQFRTILVGN
ncbi:ATP-dependent Lhr-like helicase [Neobacillus sp. B4I6]|uniref:DEAD/DEAH box helicase n=1 Tax=Neobacillus sp. B4I6 TaxID=3373925 RepID=UPI003D2028D7